MIKRTLLYKTPDDPEAFDAYFFGTHVAMARELPNLRRIEVSKIREIGGDDHPPYYVMGELWFDDEEEMAAAWASPQGQRVAADVARFNTGGRVTMISTIVE